MNHRIKNVSTMIFIVLLIFLISSPDLFAETEIPVDEPSSDSISREDESYDSYFTLYQPYLPNISAYNPMFFLVGTDPKDSMFQFSFKYRLFNKQTQLTENHPWITHFYFAYTQTSFWNLKSKSKPFEDSSYKPEIFYMTPSLSGDHSPFAGLFVQFGAQHESNGQSEEASRSTNYVYIKPIMIFYQNQTGWGLQVAPKVWAYFNNDDETNPDLMDYRGYVDLQIKLGKKDNLVMDNHIWAAKEGVSYQTDLTYPLNRHIPSPLSIYLQLQYSNRLAERLRYYTERTDVFRIGFSIIR